MILPLLRAYIKAEYTIGHLYYNGERLCDILEDPVRDLNKDGDLNDPGEGKIYGNTAIPYGMHEIIITYSPKFKRDLPLLVGVNHFEGVRIHGTRSKVATNKNTTHLKTITNCVAVGNYYSGFTQNSLDYSCIMWLYNNVAYDNGQWGFDFNFVDVANVATNNIAYSNSVGEATFSESAVDTYNSWNGGVATITAADFVSVDTSTLNNARQANGDLPVLTFLHLAGSSDAVAAGVAIGGLTLDGDGETWDDPPSIGAWEYQYETPQVSFGMSHGKHLFINGKRAVIY